MDNIPIINKVYDILKWIIPRIEKFPRKQKFVLGDRLENSLLDLQQMILVALKAENKILNHRRHRITQKGKKRDYYEFRLYFELPFSV